MSGLARQRKRERAPDQAQSPEASVAHQRLGGSRQRVAPVHERLGRDSSRAAGGLRDPIHVVHRERQRLFAEHVLARVERPDRPLGVEAVGQRDVDGVDGPDRPGAPRTTQWPAGCSIPRHRPARDRARGSRPFRANAVVTACSTGISALLIRAVPRSPHRSRVIGTSFSLGSDPISASP